MGAVHDDIRYNLLHVWDVAEIHHEVVVAEAVATLGEPYLLGTALQSLLHRVAHVSATEELGLLDVDHLACLCRSYQEVGLATKESWYLKHIANLASSFCLITLVDVGEYTESILFLDVAEHLETFLQTWSTEGVDGSAVRFVKRRLEYNIRT